MSKGQHWNSGQASRQMNKKKKQEAREERGRKREGCPGLLTGRGGVTIINILSTQQSPSPKQKERKKKEREKKRKRKTCTRAEAKNL